MLIGLLELIKNILFFMGRIENVTSFPKQLEPEEEAIWIEKLLKGDEEATQTLILHNLRLVAHIAKKYSNAPIDNEDIVSIGTIGLIKAVESYNGTKGTKLSTYAAKCIENEILMALRVEQKHKNNVFLQDSIVSDGEGGFISFLDVVQVDEDKSQDICDKVVTDKRISKLDEIMDQVLTEREKTIINFRYGLKNQERKTQMQAAQLLGISRSYVSRIETKAIEKLAREFKKVLPE
jgi:RNA polymerase sporulation-specific sigma factor